MGDIFTKEKRSEIMSRIKGCDTKLEICVRKFLFSKGFRFRKNDKRYPGSPDMVLPKYNTVIFVHGCFWHGHGCKLSKVPKSNVEYWKNKIERNKSRDKKNEKQLKSMGWNVIKVWECELSTIYMRKNTFRKLVDNINPPPEISSEEL